MAQMTIGVDLGGTNIQAGAVDASGKVVSRCKSKTRPEDGLDGVLSRIVESIEKVCLEIGTPVSEIDAVGVGAPGPIDPKTGVITEAVNLRWGRTPLADMLTEKVGVRVFVDNDVNAAIYGDFRMGAGRGARHLLGMWIGTGIGGGLILDGRPYYGHFFSAGEVGHIRTAPHSPPGTRTLENTCSRLSIVRRLVGMINANHKSILPELVGGDLTKIRSKTLAQAYSKGDALTIEIVDDAADRLGITIGNIVTLLSLERVVIGGGLAEAMDNALVDKIRDSVHKTAFPAPCRDVEVVVSQLGDDAGIIGSAMIAADRLGV